MLLNQDGNTAGSSIADFSLALGVGYFVYVDNAVTLPITGVVPTSVAPRPLQTGWNLVAVPLASTGQTATDLLNSLSTLQPIEAASWAGNSWLVHQPTDPPQSAFPLSRTAGYFVYLQQSGTWSGQTTAPGRPSLQGLHRVRAAVGLPTLPASPVRQATRTHHAAAGPGVQGSLADHVTPAAGHNSADRCE